MNGNVGLVWWVVTVPARFVYGVAVGLSRLWFGDPDPQGAKSGALKAATSATTIEARSPAHDVTGERKQPA